jgi:hypothetical protein
MICDIDLGLFDIIIYDVDVLGDAFRGEQETLGRQPKKGMQR